MYNCNRSTVSKLLVLPLALATGSLIACESQDPAACTPGAIEQELRAGMSEAEKAIPANPGYLVAMRAPGTGMDLQIATPGLDPGAPFRVASIAKTFTAAATLRLVEDGKLGLEDTVEAVVPAPLPQVLRDGGYDPAAITVRHLITHTSGLWDYAMSPQFKEAVLAQPGRHWSREDQVRFAMVQGKPLGRPGDRYGYSDTGYVLLGAILESKTGGNLAQATRGLLGLDGLGLQATWLESLEPPPAGAPAFAPQTFEKRDLFTFDPSLDLWGGGGYVSTTRDLAVFFESLLTGRVFRNPETLKTMLTIPATNAAERGGMGIYRADGIDCWFHGGFWGTLAMYCPSLQTGIAVAGMNPESSDGLESILVRALERQVSCQP